MAVIRILLSANAEDGEAARLVFQAIRDMTNAKKRRQKPLTKNRPPSVIHLIPTSTQPS